ncbi:MAG: NADPH-dependent oxidoreductase [Clostridium sp.]|nr:NADPH-dependent oxidoreductase [Clostridium sp.]
MNKTIKTQLDHRTIRKFKDKAVSDEILETLFNVANRTASSVAMQSYSIIRVTDKNIKKQISKVCKQDYVNHMPELVIFLVDAYRNAKISEEMGENLSAKRDMDRFFQGFTDASLAAQNMYTAIESLDMGAVYYGSILNDPAEIVKILKLPELTFPVVGIGFGYPDQEPMLKPRMDTSLKVFENKYEIQETYLEAIKDYDKEMQGYYDLRDADKPLDSFSKQVVGRLKNPNKKRARLLNIIRDQGFDLKLD